MEVVVTGFDPFGGEEINSAFEVVKKLPTEITGAEITKVEVSTAFGTSGEKVIGAIETHQPGMVTCAGQAGGRQTVTVEKVAISLVKARIPDSVGQQPSDVSLVGNGATAYFTNLPTKAMIKDCHDHQLLTMISYIAETFVCSDIIYRLLHLINTKYPAIRDGFIRVLSLPEQTVDKPTFTSMLLKVITNSLFYMIEAAVETREDIRLQGDITR